MPLTYAAIKNAKPREKLYRLPDGGGFGLVIHPNGSKYWELRYRHPQTGKGQSLALGVYPAVTLSAARDKAKAAKAMRAEGIDPCTARKQDKLTKATAAANTFEAVAREWLDKRKLEGSAVVTLEKLEWILSKKLCPFIGGVHVADIIVNHTNK